MKTSIISLVDSEDETVDAEYYVMEDGWVTFKSSDHKAVAAYPEARVMRIKSANASTKIVVNAVENPRSSVDNLAHGHFMKLR